MAEAFYTVLEERGVLAIAGDDRREFLQGLISNDTRKLSPTRAIYAAFLTPQGKYLHDFFLVDAGESLLLEGEQARLADLQRRLSIYRLRAKVAIANATDGFIVAVAFGAGAVARLGLAAEAGAAAPFAGGYASVDPRLSALGARLLLPKAAGIASLEAAGLARVDADAYDRLRLSLGIPDGSRDLPVEKAILLEAGFDELNGVDWEKGCYIGQELTARTKYRALIKKRLMPVKVEGPLPAPGSQVMLGDQDAGEIRSGSGDTALALLRLEMVEAAAQSGTPLMAGGVRVTPIKPGWARF